MRIAGGLVAALLALASCGDDRVCTLIGSDESSAHVALSSSFVRLDHELREHARLVVEVRRRGRVISRGAAEVPVETWRPNGPDCPPVCRRAAARLDVDSGTLEPA